MSLSEQELVRLVELIRLTRQQELNCDECLDVVAEFAELNLSGKPIASGLEAVQHHLAVCDECREEYETLRQLLESMGSEQHA